MQSEDFRQSGLFWQRKLLKMRLKLQVLLCAIKTFSKCVLQHLLNQGSGMNGS